MNRKKHNARKWLLLFFAFATTLGFAQCPTVNLPDTIVGCVGDTIHFRDYINSGVPYIMTEGVTIEGSGLTTFFGSPSYYSDWVVTDSMFNVNGVYLENTVYVRVRDSLNACGGYKTDTTVIVISHRQNANGIDISFQGNGTNLCSTDIVNLQSTSGFVNYLWNTGETTPNISVPAGNYSVKATDPNDLCVYKASVDLQAHEIYQAQQLCIVTVDTATGRNLVVWEQTPNVDIATYKIWKRNDITSQYDSIGVVPVDSFSTFIDVNSDPPQQSSSYAISVIDAVCGNESVLSPVHTTVHLSANVGVNQQVNLQWDAYVGFSYNSFEVYRSNNGSVFEQIGNTANTVYSYTDLTPPSGTNYYYVAVTNSNGCNPSRSVQKSLSNILDGNGNPVSSIESISKGKVSVYPNPFTDKLVIEPNVPYQLFDMIGREVDKDNLVELPVGVYILKTTVGSTRISKIKK